MQSHPSIVPNDTYPLFYPSSVNSHLEGALLKAVQGGLPVGLGDVAMQSLAVVRHLTCTKKQEKKTKKNKHTPNREVKKMK